MDTTLIVSLLSFAGTCVGAIVGIVINTRLSNYRIEQLEKKVDLHNQVIDRTYKLEQAVGEIRGEISHIYHELDDVKK